MQSEELKPCPFCGSSDVHLREHATAQMSWVSCVCCGLEAPSETGVSDANAVAYWNRRAEAALSTDTEPDGWICEDEFTLVPDLAWKWEDEGFAPKPFYFSPQRNAEPVSSRNDEAGYVEFLNEDVPYIVRDIDGRCAILVDLNTRKYIGYRVYDPDSDFGPAAHAEPVKTAPAEEIADAVLSWMVKYDLLDAGNEYRATDVLAVLDDLKPSYQTESAAPAVAVKAAMTDDEIYHWIAACNHEPARETLRHYLSLRSAISAQVQDVVDTETYYTTENNWENMFFGHGVSKTEMAVIWDFAKQNWANADFKITITASPASKHGDAE